MTNPEIYRARSSYFFAAFIYFLAAGISAQSFFVETLDSFNATLSWSLLICYLFHLGFIRAKVTIFDEGITITNPLRETTVGWDQVQEISVKFSMYINVGGEKNLRVGGSSPRQISQQNCSRYRGQRTADSRYQQYARW